MVDPITIIGLIASVVGLVQEAKVLATTLREYHSENGKIQQTYSTLKCQLRLLEAILHETRKLVERADQPESCESGVQEALHDTLMKCHTCMESLRKILDDAPKKDDNPFKKAKQIFNNSERSKQIDHLVINIEKYIVDINNYQLLCFLGRTDLYTLVTTAWYYLSSFVYTVRTRICLIGTLLFTDPLQFARLVLALLLPLFVMLLASTPFALFWIIVALRNERFFSSGMCWVLDDNIWFLSSLLRFVLSSWQGKYCFVSQIPLCIMPETSKGWFW